MFTKKSFIERKLRGLAFRVFNKIEDNGSANFEQNEEIFFVDNLFNSFRMAS
jgi:hypothetical protein